MDATAAERITVKVVHPKRNAKKRLYNLRKYTNSPPESASRPATSALLSAPHSVIRPASIQAIRTRSAECSSEAIGATFLYTPEPMTELTVRMKAEKSPSERTSCPCEDGCAIVSGWRQRTRNYVQISNPLPGPTALFPVGGVFFAV